VSDIGKKILKVKSVSKKIDLLTEYLDQDQSSDVDDKEEIASSLFEAAKYAQEYSEVASAACRLPIADKLAFLRACADSQDEGVRSMGPLFLIFQKCGEHGLISEYWEKWKSINEGKDNSLIQLANFGELFDEIREDASAVKRDVLSRNPDFEGGILTRPVNFENFPWLSHWV